MGQSEGPGPSRNSAAREPAVRRPQELALTALIASLTGVLAWFSVPLPILAVPFTGQTMGVMLSGLLLGPRLGASSMLLYLMMGAIGVPVFAGGQSGVGVLAGPTAGFLLGFIPCAWVTGFTARRLGPPTVTRLALALVPGVTSLFLCGAMWPWITMGLPAGKVLAVFVLPYIPVEILKAALVAPLAYRLLIGLPALPGNFRDRCTNDPPTG